MLGHGKADWVKNVLAAGEADVHLFRRDVHVTNPRIVPIGGDTSNLPWIVRRAARRVRDPGCRHHLNTPRVRNGVAMAANADQNQHVEPAVGVPAVAGPAADEIHEPGGQAAVRFLPGTSVITHRGRKSGKPYETVMTTYRKGDLLAIALGHGKTDWVKNVLAAGEADVRLFRRELHVTNPRILPAGTTDPSLPWAVRLQNRQVAVLVTDVA